MAEGGVTGEVYVNDGQEERERTKNKTAANTTPATIASSVSTPVSPSDRSNTSPKPVGSVFGSMIRTVTGGWKSPARPIRCW